VRDLIELAGAFAGLAAFLGLAVLAFLYFAQARDVRRLREWAGGAPERDAGLVEASSTIAAERSEELRRIEEERRRREEAREAEEKAAALREHRRLRRERGLPEESRWERLTARVGGAPGEGRRLPAPRYLALIVGAVIVLGGGVAFAAVQLLGGDEGGHKAAAQSDSRPGEIEVAVLNGTAVSGLAGRFGDRLERDGFNLGAVTNSASSFSQSVVMYTRGRRPEARMVAKDLGIGNVTLMTPAVATPAAGAPVAVVVGEDRAGSPPAG
jgi:hypothetical protein